MVVRARRATLIWRTRPLMNDITTQYRIITAGAGWIDKTDRGRLRFEGADAASFLQALLSNEIAALPSGAGTYALYLTPQGRLVADLHVFVRPSSLIVDVPVQRAAALAAAFDNLIFSEDARVSDVSTSLRQITVVGAESAAVLSRALGIDAVALLRLPPWSQVDVGHGFVARTDDAEQGSWDVIAAADDTAGVVAGLERAGATPAPAAVIDAMRIEAGRPSFGIDMTEETIPLEAGLLDRAISQTKGCYVGQEVIIRVLHRGGGRVARRLVRLSCEPGAAVPQAGAAISIDDRDVGRVTSAAMSPRDGRPLALGYVQRDSAEPGRQVISWWAGERTPATISGLAG